MPELVTVLRFIAFMSLSVFSTPSAGQIVLSGLLSHPLIKPIQQGISIPSQVTQAALSLCNQPITALLGKLATVRASQLCQDFSLDRPSLLKCTVVDLADQATQALVSVCRRHEQAPLRSTALDGTPIPVLLPDKRPIPAGSWEGKEKAQLLAEEGATYYWHVTNVINLFLWAPCHPILPYGEGVPKNSTDWLVPKGWTNVKMIYVVTKSPRTRESVNSTRLPAIANLKSADGSRLDIIVRGTRSSLEWATDFTYQQVRDPAYPGMVSLGFSRAADYVWPMLKPVLDEHIVKGTVKYVTISGHSLGAAVSSLLAYRMQVYLDEQLPAVGKKPLPVTALLFACPNVGDDEFVASFNKKINARRITFGIDAVPQVPCAPQMLACADPANSSYTPSVLSNNYQKIGGNIGFEPADMPVQQEAWVKMDTVNVCRFLPWAIASHVCSYTCYFSKFVNATEYSRCKLWGGPGVPAEAGYSDSAYCVGYPQDSSTYPSQLPGGSKIVLGRR